MTHHEFRKAKFTIAVNDDDYVFTGWTRGEINGQFVVPYFCEDVARLICEVMTDEHGTLKQSQCGAYFVYLDNDTDELTVYEYDCTSCIQLWAIGTGWCWAEVPPAPLPPQ